MMATTTMGLAALATGQAAALESKHAGEALAPGLAKLAANAIEGEAVIRVEGRIPERLSGALYRNGPGLFERDGHRKAHLLDGDGFVQRLALAGGEARHTGRFVRTPKFVEEDEAGRFKHPTWTTRAPGAFSNLGGRIESQAGVTVYAIGGRVYALDEVAPIFELDPQSLDTLRPISPGLEDLPFSNKAHVKIDPASGRWALAGMTFGRTPKLHVVERAADGAVLSHRVVADVPSVYIHDFFLTRTKAVFLLHPAMFNPFPFIAGLRSFTDSLTWRPEQGGRILVVDREGEPNPVWIDAPAVFMWHALNAYERADGRIVMDFVGFDAPDHFIGDDPQLAAFMEGRLAPVAHKGEVRRWTVDLAARAVDAATVSAENHEFPFVDPRLLGSEHRYGYFAANGVGALPGGVARIDLETGVRAVFDHGAAVIAGEPVFARDPQGGLDQGWLLQQCLDGATGTTFFAVLDAARVADGPLARIWLDRHEPISFHGWWAEG
jgi:all-trans-8'-apo-beta-carotenal 15,15'-oxygenase